MESAPPVLVTGGANGIGAAVCAGLKAAGCTVIALDLMDAPHADQTIRCDLGNQDDLHAALEDLTGPFAGLVQAAGLPGTQDPATVFAVNFLAPRAIGWAFRQRIASGGAMVLVSSIAAARCDWTADRLARLISTDWQTAQDTVRYMGLDGTQAYELSKRALNAWMPQAAHAFAAHQVRVNTVSPGPVETRILDDFKTSMGPDRLDKAARVTGRHGRPDEIAAAILFLLSDGASWINGIDLSVDGGYHALRSAGAS